jgi:glycosyltransferase involved in cell wall biosynthesis
VGAIGPIRVSAIVPNYNHAGFLKERLHSIRRQTSPVAEIIILDDASTDDSRDVIEGFVRETDIPVVTLFNEENSGSVFNQWAKGLARATGDLVWICESDDSCDRNFLKALAPYFDDPCVMLAFGMIDLIDEEGHPQPGLKDYMDSAAAGFWEEPHVLSARSWFHGPLGIRNVIPNVGGCVFRRQQLSESLVDELRSYRICGDWHLYSVIARGGAIAYEPKARSYFRRHSSNTTRDGFKTEAFFDEHIAIAHAVCRHYGSSDRTIAAMRGHVMDWYRYEFGDEAGKAYAGRHPLSEYLAQKQTIPHAVICLPAEEGGAATRVEVRLANALAKTGCDVSLLVLDGSNGIGQRPPGLCPNIAIFGSSFVNRLGLPDFVEEFAVDVLGTFGDWPEQAGLNTPGTSEIKARGITGSGCKVLFPNVSDDEESLSETALSSGVIRTREQAQDFFVELTRLSGGSAFMLRNTWRLHRERRRQGTRGAA